MGTDTGGINNYYTGVQGVPVPDQIVMVRGYQSSNGPNPGTREKTRGTHNFQEKNPGDVP
jgi:hypothetical protein